MTVKVRPKWSSTVRLSNYSTTGHWYAIAGSLALFIFSLLYKLIDKTRFQTFNTRLLVGPMTAHTLTKGACNRHMLLLRRRRPFRPDF
jgi:hypothetical protein